MDTATIGQTLLHLVWPQTCAHCREDLPRDWAAPLCLSCRLRLIPAEPPYCLRCSEPLRSEAARCRACARKKHACRIIRGAFLYREAAVSLVHAFKYRGRRSAARAAGTWMAQALERFPELGRPDALVPVPLHPRRRRQRGYNQALLLCETLSAATGIPISDCLRRTRDTKPQWALGREERLKNLKEALVGDGGIADKRFWVIDDVCTSSASLEACAQALQDRGAAGVSGYVFARQAQDAATS